jgi:DNA repair protein RecN (Recombination protein N)
MLNQIYIRNFAIIDALELEFRSGMTVLTGETGAGKSILVDALGLVLGDRADSDVVRHGEERAEISAEFNIDTLPAVLDWLKENDLDEENSCTLRRVVSNEGRSKCYINGRPSSLQLIKELGEMLVDIHGQHQHQSLLKADIQRQLLDDYCGNQKLADETRALQQRWKNTLDELEQLSQSNRDRDARLDLLRYHLQELDGLALEPNEFQSLEEEQRRLAHGGRLLEQCASALNTLYDSEEVSAQGILDRSLNDLEELRDIDPRLSNICILLNEASIQIQEASNELRHYVEQLEIDPERLQWVEQRLGAIHDLARKHHAEPEALLQLQQSFSDELNRLENADIELGQLQKQLDELHQQYQTTAKKLSQARAKGAKKLSAAVTEIIRQLGMPAGEFAITLLPREEQTPHRHGLENISFEVAANPGQPSRPLNKVASGGELSRISLAIQVLLANNQKIPTLIFDEVDTGIGGAVAETVGRQLRTLGVSHQVMCVTHLPQVAALGHHHLQVSKSIEGKSTRTKIQVLSNDQRQEEIARMLGGMEITQQTRAHAKEMIDRAEALA